MRLAAGFGPDPLGSYSAPEDFLAVIKGEGRVRKTGVENREVRVRDWD